jgi:hypothetical protein
MKKKKLKIIQQGKTVTLCHDESCPKCGFPETLTVCIEKTLKPIRFICSKRCGWYQDIKK